MEKYIANGQNIPFLPFSHKLNDDDFCAQQLNFYQFLYVFHCTTKLSVDILKGYDKTIEEQQQSFLDANP